MNKPLLAAGALLLGGIVTGGAIFVASSGGEEEAVQIQESASPSASVTPGSLAPSPTRTPSTSSPSSTPASSSAPTPSPPTIPDGWVLHSQQPSERSPAFSFAYPSNWFPYSTSNDVPGDGLSVSVYSFNRVEWGQPSNYPPESMKVDINVANAQRVGACGPSGGEPTSLGGFPARQVVTYYDPPHPSGVVRSITISGVHGPHCYIVLGAFAQTSPDEQTFHTIVDSFRVAD